MLRNEEGYTIVEVIVAIQVFTLIITMLYTAYLYGYKFYLRWDENSDLLRTELQVNKLFLNELQNASEIIEITNDRIIYLTNDYTQKQIHWKTDSLFYNDHLINKSGINFNLTEMLFIYGKDNVNKSLSLQGSDKNSDNRLSRQELYELNGCQLAFIIQTKHFKKNFTLLITLFKTKENFVLK